MILRFNLPRALAMMPFTAWETVQASLRGFRCIFSPKRAFRCKLTHFFRSDSAKSRQILSANSEHEKNPGSRIFPGFFDDLKLRSALAELRRATGGRLSRAARGFDGLSLAADAATAKDATGRPPQKSTCPFRSRYRIRKAQRLLN